MQQLRIRVGSHADDDPIRIHEVIDRGTFLEKFRIAGHATSSSGCRFESTINFRVGANRYGALDDHQRLGLKALGKFGDDRPHGGKVRGAVGGLRRTHGQKDQVRALHSGGQVGREVKSTLGRVANHQLAQAGFVDGNLTLIEPFDFLHIDINTTNLIAAVGKTGPRDQADVAGANNGNSHLPVPLYVMGLSCLGGPRASSRQNDGKRLRYVRTDYGSPAEVFVENENRFTLSNTHAHCSMTCSTVPLSGWGISFAPRIPSRPVHPCSAEPEEMGGEPIANQHPRIPVNDRSQTGFKRIRAASRTVRTPLHRPVGRAGEAA